MENNPSKARGNPLKPSIASLIIKNKSSYLFLAPFAIFFLLFTVLPVLAAIGLSFFNFNMIEVTGFAGADNYIRMLFDDDVFLIAVKNTLVFAFLTGPVSYILCLILAWLVNEVPKNLRIFLTLILYAPSITGGAIFIWSYIFSGDSYGLITSLFMKIGVLQDPINWLIDDRYNLGVIIIIQLWLSLGAGFLSFIAGFQTVDRSIYEAGAIDGIRNRFQELWYLTLPSMRPQLMFGAVMQIAASFSVSAVPMQLTGFPSTNNSTTTIVMHVLDNGTIRMEMGYACAIATVLFVTMIITRNLVSRIIKSE